MINQIESVLQNKFGMDRDESEIAWKVLSIRTTSVGK